MLRKCTEKSKSGRSYEAGVTLAEALVAISLVTAGILALANLVPSATRTDYGSRSDGTATFVASQELEQILAQPFLGFTSTASCASVAPTNVFQDAADGSGTPECVNLNAGGATLTSAGFIDFSAATVANYSRTFQINQSTGGNPNVTAGQYDVRWHITLTELQTGCSSTNPHCQMMTIIVAAKPTGTVPGMIAVPANLQAVKMF